jgi:hypothetical protein
MSAIRDPHVAAGLVRRRDDQRIYRFPDGMTCAYCGEVAPVGEKERP